MTPPPPPSSFSTRRKQRSSVTAIPMSSPCHFRDKDVICLLRSLLKFSKKYGTSVDCIPFSTVRLVHESLRGRFTHSQVGSKLRRLRTRYHLLAASESRVITPHMRTIYDLGRQIWGQKPKPKPMPAEFQGAEQVQREGERIKEEEMEEVEEEEVREGMGVEVREEELEEVRGAEPVVAGEVVRGAEPVVAGEEDRGAEPVVAGEEVRGAELVVAGEEVRGAEPVVAGEEIGGAEPVVAGEEIREAEPVVAGEEVREAEPVEEDERDEMEGEKRETEEEEVTLGDYPVLMTEIGKHFPRIEWGWEEKVKGKGRAELGELDERLITLQREEASLQLEEVSLQAKRAQISYNIKKLILEAMSSSSASAAPTG